MESQIITLNEPGGITSQIMTTVYCTVLFEAIHNWPGCPFEEVKYLRDPHRHVFYIRAYKQVRHDDRDVEFIMLKHEIEKYLRETYPDHNIGSTSCEMLGRKLIERFDLIQVDVSEDDENGAVLTVVLQIYDQSRMA